MIHLLVALLALAGLVWLAGWATGFTPPMQVLAMTTTGLFILMLLVAMTSGLVNGFQRLMLGPVHVKDDRGEPVRPRLGDDDFDRADRAVFAKFEMPATARGLLLIGGAVFGGMFVLWIQLLVPPLRMLPLVAQIFLALVATVVYLLTASRALDRMEVTGATRGLLHMSRCGACGYRLREIPPEPDGCRVCPECGAAWRLRGDQATPR